MIPALILVQVSCMCRQSDVGSTYDTRYSSVVCTVVVEKKAYKYKYLHAPAGHLYVCILGTPPNNSQEHHDYYTIFIHNIVILIAGGTEGYDKVLEVLHQFQALYYHSCRYKSVRVRTRWWGFCFQASKHHSSSITLQQAVLLTVSI